jgi:hypothetical protein
MKEATTLARKSPTTAIEDRLDVLVLQLYELLRELPQRATYDLAVVVYDRVESGYVGPLCDGCLAP